LENFGLPSVARSSLTWPEHEHGRVAPLLPGKPLIEVYRTTLL
jgi:hypothetical protein